MTLSSYMYVHVYVVAVMCADSSVPSPTAERGGHEPSAVAVLSSPPPQSGRPPEHPQSSKPQGTFTCTLETARYVCTYVPLPVH